MRRTAPRGRLTERPWPRNRRCDAGAPPKKSRESSSSSPRTTRRISLARRLSSMEDTRSGDEGSWRRQRDAFHEERAPGSARVTRDDEGRAPDGELFADNPMAASAPAHEPDV